MTALDPPLDRGVIGVAYGQLSKKGYEPLPFKKRLLHWTGISPFPEDCLPALTALAALDVEALVPKKGLFPDPALANAVAVLVPIWKKVTGRTAGPISADRVGDQKKYPFADWLAEMHDLLGVAQPPVGRVLDIVRGLETQKNPAPVTTVKDGNN